MSRDVRSGADRDFSKGSLERTVLGSVPFPFARFEYPYFTHHRSGMLSRSNAGKVFSPRVAKYSFPEGRYTVTILGSSTTENFVVFLPYSFRKTQKLRTNFGGESHWNMKYWAKDILDFGTQILIVQFNNSIKESFFSSRAFGTVRSGLLLFGGFGTECSSFSRG
ncbi:MAG: hypothetical protein MJ016_00080 [Victivallaceae bacterium]|nr:hypothetical protein [Victivallaceae bacterium]